MKRLFVAGVLMLAASPAIAQTVPAQAPKSQAVVSTDSSDANRIVCKREDTVGSRLGAKRVCLTVQEWKDRADFHRDATERIQHSTPVTPSG
jgi:hypothetical protein